MLFKKVMSVILVLMLACSSMGSINAASIYDKVVIDRSAYAWYDELYVSGIKVNYHNGDQKYEDIFTIPHNADLFCMGGYCTQSVSLNPDYPQLKFTGNYYMKMENCAGPKAIGIIETSLNSVELDPDFVFDNIQYKFYCDRDSGYDDKFEDSDWLTLPSKILLRTEYQTGYDKVRIQREDYSIIKEFSGGN
jgi:opacity protein-like surface antigen